MNNQETIVELEHQKKMLDAKLMSMREIAKSEEETKLRQISLYDSEEKKTRRPSEDPRNCSVGASVSEAEREKAEQVCDEYAKKKGWRARRGAIFRMVLFHFMDNYKTIDLEIYKDE